MTASACRSCSSSLPSRRRPVPAGVPGTRAGLGRRGNRHRSRCRGRADRARGTLLGYAGSASVAVADLAAGPRRRAGLTCFATAQCAGWQRLHRLVCGRSALRLVCPAAQGNAAARGRGDGGYLRPDHLGHLRLGGDRSGDRIFQLAAAALRGMSLTLIRMLPVFLSRCRLGSEHRKQAFYRLVRAAWPREHRIRRHRRERQPAQQSCHGCGGGLYRRPQHSGARHYRQSLGQCLR